MVLRDVTDSNLGVLIREMQNKSSSTSTYQKKTLKYVSGLITPLLSTIINGSLNRGILPDSLKVAKVILPPTKCAVIDVSGFRHLMFILSFRLYHYLWQNQVRKFDFQLLSLSGMHTFSFKQESLHKKYMLAK